ncbi:MAG: response regulator [Candidatus Eremiobacteraeota bacterium]|nr:response regulator [Candidatus Eremiobacteraeota bacterium]
MKTVHILLIEDNPGDIRLTQEALSESSFKINLDVVKNGVEALEFLYRQGDYSSSHRPDLILMDLNLPRKSGHEVLQQIKEDENLCKIPVVILTTSESHLDVCQAYLHHANSYVTKPVGFDQFTSAMKRIQDYWFGLASLPA